MPGEFNASTASIIALFFGERRLSFHLVFHTKQFLAMDSTILHVSQVNARHIYIVNTYVTSSSHEPTNLRANSSWDHSLHYP